MSSHHEELQEIENVKHYWRNGGKWLVAALVAAALGYLGNVVYQGHLRSNNEKAAAQAAQVQGDSGKLSALQQAYGNTPAAAQATLAAASSWFAAGKTDEAAAAYRWVLQHQKAPLFQAMAAQNLANILLQQKKYDDALAALNTPVDEAFAPVFSETKGDILAAQGKNSEAAAAYQAALDKLPETAPTRELITLKMGQL